MSLIFIAFFGNRFSHKHTVYHRQKHNTHHIRHRQTSRYSKRLITENCTCHAIYENQRHKHRHSGERRTQKRRNQFVSSTHTRCTESASTLLPLCNVFADNQRVINHHTHHKNQSRKRYNIHRFSKHVKRYKCDNYRRYHTYTNHHRRTQSAHKHYCH